MRIFLISLLSSALLAAPAFAAERDPIFESPRATGPVADNCLDRDDNRNIVVRGATSSAGQTIIGGLLGAFAGNQIGSGTGNDIATGVGAAAGAAAGAWNANRQENERIRECRNRQGLAGTRASQRRARY